MASVVDICNMALNRVGNNQTIASLDEGSTESDLCARWYPQVRDYVLREYPWPFATRRAPLAELAATDQETANGLPGDWWFKYACPTDCLAVRALYPKGTRNPRPECNPEYAILSDGVHKAIYTDLPEAEITYTSQVTDTTMFDPMFISAVACLLGAEIAMPLTVHPNVAAQARQAYAELVNAAIARGLNESPELRHESVFLEAYQ